MDFNLAAEDPGQCEVPGTPPLRRLDDANRLSSKVAVGEA